MAIEKDDWRLFRQEEYLLGKTLRRARFCAGDSEMDHTHCDFCWDKFSENAGDLHEGYVTLDGRYWICDSCFADFKDRFGWTVENTQT